VSQTFTCTYKHPQLYANAEKVCSQHENWVAEVSSTLHTNAGKGENSGCTCSMLRRNTSQLFRLPSREFLQRTL
jgi:hypothetical protein